MTNDQIEERKRLLFLADVVQAEAKHLLATDAALFAKSITTQDLNNIGDNLALTERIDAFAARFGRLQDTLGDKLMPALFNFLLEKVGPVIDNLNRAEKLGWLESAQAWQDIRGMRNRLIHEYIVDMQVLAEALNDAHVAVPLLVQAMHNMVREVKARIS